MMNFFVGQTAAFSRTVTETDIVMFAGLSGDYNPVHVDQEYAVETRFGLRIAHGLLTTSFLSRLLGMELPGKGSVYLEQSLKFLAPVFIGDTITASAEILEIDQDRGILRLETICRKQDNTIVLKGEAKMMMPKEGAKI
ncbi:MULTISPECIES: MaoC family dehydratase [Bacillaceae]|uniref:MaoC family dehydratase n=1 Tax=Bacillaceae TaxID=186817 RepID=UPI0006AFC0D2|nr:MULTISPECIES: MaoC family dehydratase [Bacillaceae]ALC86911.1 enoyl-CoA hydratase [Bacillus sp. FJAT-22090]KQL37381.1 enoyl-CoA hydratase [Psychrobacillus sp. FJAT-21963]MDF2067836.1 MaoC family dehydratase [Bacillus sp. Cr_A10]